MSESRNPLVRHLIAATGAVALTAPSLSRFYGQQLLSFCSTNKIELSSALLNQICRHCGLFLIPGETAMVTIKKVTRLSKKKKAKVTQFVHQTPSCKFVSQPPRIKLSSLKDPLISKKKYRTKNYKIIRCTYCKTESAFRGVARPIEPKLAIPTKALPNNKPKAPQQGSKSAVAPVEFMALPTPPPVIPTTAQPPPKTAFSGKKYNMSVLAPTPTPTPAPAPISKPSAPNLNPGLVSSTPQASAPPKFVSIPTKFVSSPSTAKSATQTQKPDPLKAVQTPATKPTNQSQPQTQTKQKKPQVQQKKQDKIQQPQPPSNSGAKSLYDFLAQIRDN